MASRKFHPCVQVLGGWQQALTLGMAPSQGWVTASPVLAQTLWKIPLS